jgi:glycosyltransferase involved in cell wall biosynthesis
MPLLSVVIPTLNSERYLRFALESIINQSFKDYECVVVDGGSTDSTLNILDSYRSRMKSLKIIEEKKASISTQLNTGIRSSDSKFIGRMDSDDICLPERFKLQINKLNEGYNIVGGAINVFGATPTRKITYPEQSELLLLFSTIRNPFAHPSVLMDRIINPIYNEDYDGIEDYELWSRIILEKKYKLTNIRDAVINYRVHKNQISKIVDDRIINLKYEISKSLFTGLNVDKKYLNVIMNLATLKPINSLELELFAELFCKTRTIKSSYQDFIWFEEIRKGSGRIPFTELARTLQALNSIFPTSVLIEILLTIQFLSPDKIRRYSSRINTLLFSKLALSN